ncbi:MAG: folate-binding protein YgfZ [Gammaproteobacteria bacterium]|nr:folate-binding protein YgfZ [Gammaproteobacteria bacterium]
MSNEKYPDILDPITLSDSTSDIHTQNLICQLSYLNVVAIHGDDAQKFLHGQLINDVEGLADNSLQLNGYCDPKGRLLALFHLIRLGDKYLMLIDQSISKSVIKRLQMFVLMAEVEFEPSTLKCIGFVQNNTQKTPTLIKEASLASSTVCSNNNGLILALLQDKPARYILIGDSSQLGQAWNSLSKNNLNCDDTVWHLLNVRLGQPSLAGKTQGAFVPQMMNLDLINGLSFSKGCYPGQEVVARMHHLGKLKRRMYRLHIRCEEQPLAGDGIYSLNSDINAPQGHIESVGKIVSAVKINDDEFDALAVLQIKHKEDSNLYLDDGDDTTLSITDLPYKIKES